MTNREVEIQVSAEAAQRMLKDLMFRLWADEACESASDIVKLLSLIDFYLPFFPLEREHIRELFNMKLRQRAQEMLAASQIQLTWGEEIIDFLISKVWIVLRELLLQIMDHEESWRASVTSS